MSSSSAMISSSAEVQVSRKHLGSHTGPSIHTVKDRRDQSKKYFKRTDVESPERPKKRRRTSRTSAPTNTRAAFKAKYAKGRLLGEGSFGSVFAGYRRHDNMPVAIKSIRLRGRDLPKDELILILGRPVPCVDLFDYVDSTHSTLQEGEAKIIIKQLVDALIEIHSKGVFHRDIKPDNILCETGPGGPRIRIINFGCGTFLKEGMFTTALGASLYSSPEWFLGLCYRAEQATVWQLGVVLHTMLHMDFLFKDTTDITQKDVCVRDDLSFDCRDLLLSCLNKDPAARPSLRD